MKKAQLIILILLLSAGYTLHSQQSSRAEVFLLTCSPGTETYSIYGHSALRIVIPELNHDMVYNWGVFDFATPNFVWKFAKGRLEYMLGAYSFERFMQEYIYEERSVYQQKLNLEPPEIDILISLISENLKPENLRYRYDFFYDNCATRIRDLIEKTVGSILFYPPELPADIPTFRTKITEYQQPYPWLLFGIDLLLGTPADKKADLRARMFLPLELKNGLSDARINRSGKMIPLLQNPSALASFNPPELKRSFLTAPLFVFSMLLILIIVLSATIRGIKPNKAIDIVIFSVFSLLALLILFFSFFTDHDQTRWNLNIIWLSPFIIMCLISLILNREWYIWFRLVFFLSLTAFVLQLIFPSAFNPSFMLLELILAVRCSVRSGFSWNPLSLYLTEN